MWWTTVGFGGNPCVERPWQSTEQAAKSIRRWMRSQEAGAGSLIAAHTIRAHEYLTRAQARNADINDSNDDGLINRMGLYDFLAAAGGDDEP